MIIVENYLMWVGIVGDRFFYADEEMSRRGGDEKSCKKLLKSEFFSVCLMIIVENYLMWVRIVEDRVFFSVFYEYC